MEIKVCDLVKSYNDKKVLDGINLTFNSETPVCIMAPSGRGKTTLISVILGLVMPDGGRVEITGGDKFSAVFQEDRLAEELSAVMNLAITEKVPDRGEILAFLQDFGLEKEECLRPVSQLSGGQKRRVAIARALYADSDRVIMDEPFKGLDNETKVNVINQVKNKLCGRLLILVSHDESDAGAFSARVLKL